MDKLFKFKHFSVIKDNIGEINKNFFTNFFTFGQWHSFELLLYILSFTGTCKLTITTFGLSEQAIRTLQKVKDAGLVSQLTVIINLSARRYKKKLLFFLQNTADEIFLQNIHAKIFLFENNIFNCAVNQSANFSTNPTNESGYISTKENDIFDFKNFIQKTIEISKPLKLNEL